MVVYQGLGGRHQYNSDRHHAFILEGARDLAVQCTDRGVGYVLHVPRDPSRPGPLPQLCERAAALVVEDFPAPPFPNWTARLVERVRVPVVAVDAHCTTPMRSHGRWFDRAFKFESKTKKAFSQRIHHRWVNLEPEVRLNGPLDDSARSALLGEVAKLEAVDPLVMDITDLCERCQIDHSVPRVPHTMGGSQAGYARWEAFRERGLNGYAKRRNNAASLDGVSRLSAYLHYGMVSPFRIAREAAAQMSEGAAKFLNELLVWRELAHAFCYYFEGDPESLAALPDWARQTLADHADDSRDEFDWETLTRGRTGDALWDAAQRSLLRQGELHNNLRMTWGKAIPLWSRDAKEALRRLFDLNHRFALDGNDPNSYGGLLWCLGQFDRPFEPERPVLGRIRGRSTEEHAARLDLAKYESIATRSRAKRVPRVAVVGGGLAGLAAARTLQDHGVPVRVFDKGRGPGGRSATRFVDRYRFDHGAGYITTSDERFSRHITAWRERGVVADWSPRVGKIERGTLNPSSVTIPEGWLVGSDGMHGMCRHLAKDVEVSFGVRIERLERGNEGWTLFDADGRAHGSFDRILLNVPAPQASALLASTSETLAECVAGVVMGPCWTTMVVAEGLGEVGVDAVRSVDDASPIAWASRECSKPGRSSPNGVSAWVVQASTAWSAEHLEREADDIVTMFLPHFEAALRAKVGTPILATAHRWRYGLCSRAWDDDCHLDEKLGIGLCGDWFASCAKPGRIESAFLSGVALAGRVLARIGDARDADAAMERPLFASGDRSGDGS